MADESAIWFEKRILMLQNAFTPEYFKAIDIVVSLLAKSFSMGQKLLICGNGGSAADAQHITAEFVGRFLKDRKGLPAIALTTNTSVLTAWSNDHEYDSVFARQIETLGNANDILLAISTSGHSPNIIKALESAKNFNLVTIGLAGNHGGMMTNLTDFPLFVSETHTPYIQEIHLITYHRICEQVECHLFK